MCDLLATLDAELPGEDGSRMLLLARQLRDLLGECELVFGNYHHDPKRL